jgi:hypothetical protein
MPTQILGHSRRLSGLLCGRPRRLCCHVSESVSQVDLARHSRDLEAALRRAILMQTRLRVAGRAPTDAGISSERATGRPPETAASTGSSRAPVDRPQPCTPLSRIPASRRINGSKHSIGSPPGVRGESSFIGGRYRPTKVPGLSGQQTYGPGTMHRLPLAHWVVRPALSQIRSARRARHCP